ncbi:MAG: nuclear transport factor 2 family protein [Acidimicrobiales bacterium]
MANPQHRDLVRQAFTAWEQGDSRPFFRMVADDVRWTVIGTTPLSGAHEGKRAFLAATAPFAERLAGPIKAKIVDVLDAGDKVVLQWEGSAEGTNGRPYRQTYCWVMRLDGDQVAEVTAYLDTEMVNAMFAD